MITCEAGGQCWTVSSYHFLKKAWAVGSVAPSPQTKISHVLVSKNTFKDVFDNTCDIGDFCAVKIAERFPCANEQRKGYFG